MKALLDTNVFLWSLLDDGRLSNRARRILSDGENALFVSVATGWETVIKARLGKLKLPGSPGRVIPEAISKFSFEVLPIQLSHVLEVESLPDHHRDPFDRILIAQSKVEKLPILTPDPLFTKYGVEVVW